MILHIYFYSMSSYNMLNQTHTYSFTSNLGFNILPKDTSTRESALTRPRTLTFPQADIVLHP